MATLVKSIAFDMDGCLVDFYGVEGWLNDLENFNVRPYAIAKPLVNLSALARRIHLLQSEGYEVNIISWLSKSGTPEYNARVSETKYAWLAKHLPSVRFDNIRIVPYGTPKHELGMTGLLFDDEERNRVGWESETGNIACDVDNILEILRQL